MTYILRDETIKQRCLSEVKGLLVKNPAVFQVKIGKADNSLTASQRNYFHKILELIEQQTGYYSEDLKIDIKYRVLPLREVVLEGRTHLHPISSEKLSKGQYSELIEAALLFANQAEVTIPGPEFWGYRDMKVR